MKFFVVYVQVWVASLCFGAWQGSYFLGVGVLFLFQAYLVANDLPKE